MRILCDKYNTNNIIYIIYYVGRDSSVGIATRYRLDGTGIESRWGQGFPYPSIPTLWPTQPPIQWVPGFSGGKTLTNHPYPAPKLKKE
jgi:hypothetical protein